MERSPKVAAMKFLPLIPKRWDDFVELFGERGAYGGCWCMWWRQTGAEHQRYAGAANRRAMKAIVEARRTPGLIGYARGRPVGWCSIAPRAEFGRLNRSPNLRGVDDAEVWSIVCFFVARDHRGSGVASALLDAAVSFAATRGAAIVEAYPVDRGGLEDPSAFTGPVSLFRAAGFKEVARRAKDRPIMRLST